MIGINSNNLKIERIAHNKETHILLTVFLNIEPVRSLNFKTENLKETLFRPGPPDLECLVYREMSGHDQVAAVEF